MKTIDLTTTAAALAYLRSLPAETEISLPGAYHTLPNSPAADAVEVLAGESANAWATAAGRWDWTAGELVQELAPQTDSDFEVSVYTDDDGLDFASVRHLASGNGADFYKDGSAIEWQENNSLLANCPDRIIESGKAAALKALADIKSATR